MTDNPILGIYKHGQSIWYDNLRRGLLASGDIERMIRVGEIVGITSNPTIFDKAISQSTDYDSAISDLLARTPDLAVLELYEKLILKDIQTAADLLRPLFDRTNGGDGYVSLEVSPHLAYDTDNTLTEARRLFAAVDRPNLMIKVPATAEGLPAITQLISEGINVNVTLMFSLQDYRSVADAYLAGLESMGGEDLSRVASVASFFVSRIDVAVDKLLPEDSSLRGKAGIANCKAAYEIFQKTFASERFAKLKQRGARVQRFLCASTGAKDPAYRDVMYVEELIGPDTINTVPPATLDAFRDHGQVRTTIVEGVDDAKVHLATLAEQGIDLEQVHLTLKAVGVDLFIKSFDNLMVALDQKRTAVLAHLSGA